MGVGSGDRVRRLFQSGDDSGVVGKGAERLFTSERMRYDLYKVRAVDAAMVANRAAEAAYSSATGEFYRLV